MLNKSGSKLLTQKEDQQSSVSADQLGDFPYDCIGYLKTISINQTNPLSKIGSGFLVSRFLLLTSANLLIASSKDC